MSELEDMINKKMSRENSIRLRPKQEEAYSYMVRGENIFITGAGGVGKSALIKMFMKMYQYSKQIVLTSTTGTSALLLNGTTIHSYLGIGYGNGSVEALVDKICGWGWLRKRWLSIECLIIDEISMLDPDLFDKLEEIARSVRRNDKPFGGIQLILSGDYCQLPCVGTDKFCFEAKSWSKCIKRTVYLNEIIRQSDTMFQKVLNKVRIGIVDKQVKKILDSRIGVKLHNDYGIKPTKLYSKNCDVDRVNDEELDVLAEDGRQFYEYAMDTVVYPGVSNKTAAKEKFNKNCTAPKVLQLCEGSQVMLLKNLDIQNGLANGSRGVVTSFFGDIPVVRFLNGVERVIDYDTWEVTENDKKILRARQVPLKVAYAISIHKSQGCSLDYAEIDLSGVFEYGQAYVALSRVKSLEGLSIIDIDYEYIQAHPEAVAYYESL
jgi:ATP-dependent DNA helicase PIF1